MLEIMMSHCTMILTIICTFSVIPVVINVLHTKHYSGYNLLDPKNGTVLEILSIEFKTTDSSGHSRVKRKEPSKLTS